VTEASQESLQIDGPPKNMLFFVIDEAAFGIQSERMDYVQALFAGFNNRRRSRWGKYGGGALLTSPGGEHAFVETLAGQGDDWDETVMVRRMTTWEAKGELVPGAHVFLFDRDVDVLRVVEEDLIFQGFSGDGKFGVAARRNGEEVRWPVQPAGPGETRSASV
jgi:hypothetical protein